MMSHGRWQVLVLLVGSAFLGGCQSRAFLATAREGGARLRPEQEADVQIALGHSLEKSGNSEQAMAAYQQALKNDPQRGDAMDRLAVLHARQGQFDQARPMHEKASAREPRNPDFHCHAGYSFYLQGRWSEAEGELRQALALAPNHCRAHNNLGLVLAHTGQVEEALAAFQQAGCSKAQAHANLAFILLLDNCWSEARGHYQHALALDPSSIPARKGLQNLQALQDRAEPNAGFLKGQ